jgi:hypothetical protein
MKPKMESVMKKILVLALVLGIFMLGIGAVSAQPAEVEEQIVINSADWIDVYSAICYANLNEQDSKFVTSPAQGKVLSSVLDRTKTVHLFQSSKDPILAGYKSYLEGEGFTVSAVTTSDSGKKLNIELAEKVDTTKFTILDDSYGYNALSAASYSVASKSVVLFADSDNIDEVYNFLTGRGTPEIIIYGHVDRVVREKLSEFNPEIIDHGDRFEDNLAIVDKFVHLKPSTQVVLTNGEFIEEEIMSGREPVIFIGRDIVPEEVVEYVKGSDFKSGVVIGNELIGAATRLKDRTNISVFIKFGLGRATEGGFALPEPLDMFYLPRYELNLDIVSGNYNIKTKTVEIIYQNIGETGAFAKATVGIFAANESVATVGDEEPFFFTAKTKSGGVYKTDLTKWAAKELRAHVYLEYGESRKSLTEVVEKEVFLGTVEFEDRSELSVTAVKYDTRLERLMLSLKNPASNVACYAEAELELKIEGEPEFVRFAPAEIKDETVLSERIKLTPADLAENPTVFVHIRYGERTDLRIKSTDAEYLLVVVSGYSVGVIAAVAVLAAVVTIIGLLLWRRGRRKKRSEI